MTNFVPDQFIAAVTAKGAPTAAATLSPQVLQQLQSYQFNAHKSPLAVHASWLTHGFAGIFLVLALALIVLLAVQTTKQEGLSGTIGGRVESAYRRPRMLSGNRRTWSSAPSFRRGMGK